MWYNEQMEINVRKIEAIRFRKMGYSIRNIEKRLKIPKSTLSGWLHNVKLTKKQKEKLCKDWQNALVRARMKAVIWHNAQKQKRLKLAEQQANKILRNINLNDVNVVELGLAMLYLGEGFKKTEETGMGNTDPLILKTFVAFLQKYYRIKNNQLYCQLHLRADQDGKSLKKYWSSELNLPLSCFKFIYFDKRTTGSKTYPNYKGVCIIRCGNVAIQRKLINLSKSFCEKVINTGV